MREEQSSYANRKSMVLLHNYDYGGQGQGQGGQGGYGGEGEEEAKGAAVPRTMSRRRSTIADVKGKGV